ncbi:MAG: DUF4169 family protein [Xanthobacteraceae bacterium]
MGEIVSLRVHRKRATRLQESKFAAQQRIEHGAAKQTRMLAKAVDVNSARNLDQHRLETGEGQ